MSEVFDPNLGMRELSPIIQAAASGNLEAQRLGCQIAWGAMKAATDRGDMVMAQGHAMELMFWARFAASHGESQDSMMLISALAYLSKFWSGDHQWGWYGETLMVEATAIADRLASLGDEDAAEAVNMISRSVAPHILEQAREIA